MDAADAHQIYVYVHVETSLPYVREVSTMGLLRNVAVYTPNSKREKLGE
jgi:hypothetical protein